MGAVFLMIMFMFIPVAFYKNLGLNDGKFPFHEVSLHQNCTQCYIVLFVERIVIFR